MKRAAVYLEPSRAGEIGGSQTVAAVLAEHLRCRGFEVEILVRREQFSPERLASGSGTNLEGVRIRHCPELVPENPLHVRGEFDVFAALVHEQPPICPAPLGMLFVLFPLRARANSWPWNAPADAPWLKRTLRRWHHDTLWRRRFAGYRVKTANSAYTQHWTRQRWGVETEVLYPPIALGTPPSAKQHEILSVARFSRWGMDKGQLPLLEAFGRLRPRLAAHAGWRYCIAGGLSELEDDRRFFGDCQALAKKAGAELRTNLPAAELQGLYTRSQLFWHAAGLRNDEVRTPESSEHFGMVTAEAMSHGAIPVVARRGGQPEIVRHGENGYLWETIDELEDISASLLADAARLKSISVAAAASALAYSRAVFRHRIDQYLSHG